MARLFKIAITQIPAPRSGQPKEWKGVASARSGHPIILGTNQDAGLRVAGSREKGLGVHGPATQRRAAWPNLGDKVTSPGNPPDARCHRSWGHGGETRRFSCFNGMGRIHGMSEASRS